MNLKTFIFGSVIYCLFSLSSVFMKVASAQNNLLYKGVFFCLSIGVLGIFSILWQKLLNKLNLTKAYFFKATTIIWGLIYGVLIFKEKITLTMIIGAIICLVGVVIIMGEQNHE